MGVHMNFVCSKQILVIYMSCFSFSFLHFQLVFWFVIGVPCSMMMSSHYNLSTLQDHRIVIQ